MLVTLTMSRSTVLRELEQTESGFTPLKAILRLILDLSFLSSVEALLRLSWLVEIKLVKMGKDKIKARQEIKMRIFNWDLLLADTS